ncbi:hypothetical protein L6259_03840 [Candidatus Parcubacteria bacterium]|nr:hypothetical protein [Patescibacteria group bacterium]MCG2694368.1 hypothetical protein [Candidatus Parcubacteria bacterium]
MKKPAKKRKCERCGRTLSIYNKGKECWYHSVAPDAIGNYSDYIGMGNSWNSHQGHGKTDS